VSLELNFVYILLELQFYFLLLELDLVMTLCYFSYGISMNNAIWSH